MDRKMVKLSATYTDGKKEYYYMPIENYPKPVVIGEETPCYREVVHIKSDVVDKMVEDYFDTPLGKLVLNTSHYKDKITLRQLIIDMALRDSSSNIAWIKKELYYTLKVEEIYTEFTNIKLY